MPLLTKQRRLKISAALFLAGLMTGCSSIEPWVQPYEREVLADPIMSFSRNPLIESHFSHIYEVREASRGAGVSVGGGCGCN